MSKQIGQMIKQQKSENAALYNIVYRQFSRQRYSKYRHQFPKLRESEIVSKIIKEWDSLNQADKEQLLHSYKEDKFITKREAQDDSPKAPTEKAKTEVQNLDKTAQRSVIAKAQCKEEVGNAVDSEKQGLSEHGSSRKSIQSRSAAASSHPRKPMTVGKSNYIAFYKYYYDKYHKEHKNWSSAQLSQVISILWQKRKMQYKKVSKKPETKNIKTKPINGRKMFKKQNNLTTQEARLKWAQLPKESRKMWGNPSIAKEEISKKLNVIRFGGDHNEVEQEAPIAVGQFSFLNKPIG